MAVIFVEEDLYLIGGIEQCNLRRSLVDVYNVHTGHSLIHIQFNSMFDLISFIHNSSSWIRKMEKATTYTRTIRRQGIDM